MNYTKKIKVENRDYIDIIDIGIVYLKVTVDNVVQNVKVENCYYTPRLDRNLLSVGVILDKEFKIIIERRKVQVFKEE